MYQLISDSVWMLRSLPVLANIYKCTKHMSLCSLKKKKTEMIFILKRSTFPIKTLQVISITTGLVQNFWNSNFSIVRQHFPNPTKLLIINYIRFQRRIWNKLKDFIFICKLWLPCLWVNHLICSCFFVRILLSIQFIVKSSLLK